MIWQSLKTFLITMMVFSAMASSALAQKDRSFTPAEIKMFRSAVGRGFTYLTNNCHDYSNTFSDRVKGSMILMCNKSHVKAMGGHSLNLVADPRSPQDSWCLIDPQVGSPCCFTQAGAIGRNGKLNLDFNETAARTCYQKLCGGQAVVTPKVQGKLMPPEFRARSYKTYFAECRQKRDFQSCNTCCNTRFDEAKEFVDVWTKNMAMGSRQNRIEYSTLDEVKRTCLASCSQSGN